MKNQLIIFAALTILLLLLTGCPGPNTKYDPVVIDTSKLIKGKEGITVDFATKTDTIKVGDEIFLIFNVHNRGAIPVENGIVTIRNVYHTYLDIPENTLDYTLEGKSLYMQDGESTQEEIHAKVNGIPNEKEFTFSISAIACYPYQTKFSTNICVDATRNPDNEVVKQVCHAQTQTFSSGQGGPIQVTKLEQRVRKTTDVDYALEFKIYVENTGEGTVLLPDSDFRNICTKGTWSNKFNELKATAYVSLSQELECDPPIVDKYKPNMQYYVCRGRLSDPYGSNYVTTLRFQLDYSYVNPPVEAKLTATQPEIDEEW